MIRIGDRVKFISDTGSGIVRSVSGTLASVEVEDGFEIPVMLNDIVPVTLEDEQKTADRIGYDEPKIKRQKTADGRPITQKSPKAQHYGRISMADEYEDEDPVDMHLIRSNYLKRQAAEAEKALPKVSVEASPLELTDYDVKLCFVPHNAASPETSEVSCWLVNDSSYNINYSIARNAKGVAVPLASGSMEADSKIVLPILYRSELAELQTLNINITFFKKSAFVPQPAEDFQLDIHPLKFVRRGSFLENDFFDEPSVVYTLASNVAAVAANEIVELEPDPEPAAEVAKPKASAKSASTNPEIIDLHAEELLDKTEGMTSGEILKAQLARFTIALDLAIKSKQGGKLIFIHGIGGGKLKYEMKKILDRQYPSLRYQDASFAEYGYGAMMIFLR